MTEGTLEWVTGTKPFSQSQPFALSGWEIGVFPVFRDRSLLSRNPKGGSRGRLWNLLGLKSPYAGGGSIRMVDPAPTLLVVFPRQGCRVTLKTRRDDTVTSKPVRPRCAGWLHGRNGRGVLVSQSRVERGLSCEKASRGLSLDLHRRRESWRAELGQSG